MSSNAALKTSKQNNSNVSHSDLANAISALSMDAIQKAKSGHPGLPMGMADVATVLFTKFMKFNPENPEWADRDRFVLSAGHGSMLLYSLLYLTGYKDITLDEIKKFRQLGSKTCGHPEYGEAKGIETTTGPLGQGIANAVGMALSERMLSARYGEDIIDHYTYALVGDGCLMEGISHEAISLAGHLKLSKLIVIFDDNKICIDGPTSMTVSDDQCERFRASGWDVYEIDGHDEKAIELALTEARKTDKPSMLACRTIIAKGAPTKAGTSSSHGSPLGDSEIEGAKENLGWEHEPFFVPDHILKEWRKSGKRNFDTFSAWNDRFDSLDDYEKQEFQRTVLDKKISETLEKSITDLKKDFVDSKSMATRKSSSVCLENISKFVPELIGGSADLTGSNLTITPAMEAITAEDFLGRYIYYGVREHAMCAIMNGMALHGGFIPYGGTFFVFTDYCRPAIRMAALMKQRVVYVMTHDSIGLGEDGPTHQPVEHLASLRAMPNLYVYRPADATETAECWQLSLEKDDAPSMLVLTRQGLPSVRNEYIKENKCKKGAYILSDSETSLGDAKVTIIATGSEIQIALESQKDLQRDGVATRVVSMPCTELFDEQTEEYQNSIVGDSSLKVAIEAGISLGWEKYIGRDGIFVGMDSYGASGLAEDLYAHFGITSDNVVKKVKAKL